jgi:hypothetical protein
MGFMSTVIDKLPDNEDRRRAEIILTIVGEVFEGYKPKRPQVGPDPDVESRAVAFFVDERTSLNTKQLAELAGSSAPAYIKRFRKEAPVLSEHYAVARERLFAEGVLNPYETEISNRVKSGIASLAETGVYKFLEFPSGVTAITAQENPAPADDFRPVLPGQVPGPMYYELELLVDSEVLHITAPGPGITWRRSDPQNRWVTHLDFFTRDEGSPRDHRRFVVFEDGYFARVRYFIDGDEHDSFIFPDSPDGRKLTPLERDEYRALCDTVADAKRAA